MEHDDNIDPIARYETFFKEFTTDGLFKYRDMIEKMPMQGERSLEINFDDLWNFDPKLARQTLQSPLECINAASQAIGNVMVIEAEDYATYTFHARFINLPEAHRVHLRKIRAEHIGKLISVNGILTRASEVKPQLVVGIFKCRVCEEKISIIQGDYYTKPYQCTNNSCNRKGPFNFIAQESSFIDWQKIRIQEKPEELPAGQLPRSLDSYLKEDLVDTVRPGNRITAVGILYSAQDIGQRGSLKTFHLFLEVNSLDTSEIDTERLEITPEEEKLIEDLSQDEWIHRKIIHSIAPTIYGIENVKEAIAFQLFGGVTREQKDGSRFRGESHILLVGDPGTGKSMLLQYVSKIAPRGLYTSGKGATAVGLCVSADTNVFLSNSLQPISQIVEKEFESGDIQRYNSEIEYKENKSDLKAFHIDNFKLKSQEISKVWRIKSPNKLIKLITRTGRELKLTPETSILVINQNKGLIWKKSRELKEKDCIAVTRSLANTSSKKVPSIYELIRDYPSDIYLLNVKRELKNLIDKIKIKFKISIHELAIKLGLNESTIYRWLKEDTQGSTSLENFSKLCYFLDENVEKYLPDEFYVEIKKGQKFIIPKKLDGDWFYVMGLLMGDGRISIDKRESGYGGISIGFSNRENVLLNKFLEFFQNLGCKVTISEGSKERPAEYRIWSALISHIFSKFGLTPSPKADKISPNPDIIFYPKEYLFKFLRGLYDADGWIIVPTSSNSGTIGFSSTSKKLIQFV
ncbi:MAG: LAGLIDADG family homing endonuclease, partial [Promethearchaeota archaeon]